jgi:hypothetical protein
MDIYLRAGRAPTKQIHVVYITNSVSVNIAKRGGDMRPGRLVFLRVNGDVQIERDQRCAEERKFPKKGGESHE